MTEPGSRKPTQKEEPCWQVICPMEYCGANVGQPCMNRQGRFARTHIRRRTQFGDPSREGGPGKWDERPVDPYTTRTDYLSFDANDPDTWPEDWLSDVYE